MNKVYQSYSLDSSEDELSSSPYEWFSISIITRPTSFLITYGSYSQLAYSTSFTTWSPW
jgi:hypothetical protein